MAERKETGKMIIRGSLMGLLFSLCYMWMIISEDRLYTEVAVCLKGKTEGFRSVPCCSCLIIKSKKIRAIFDRRPEH